MAKTMPACWYDWFGNKVWLSEIWDNRDTIENSPNSRMEGRTSWVRQRSRIKGLNKGHGRDKQKLFDEFNVTGPSVPKS